LKKSKGYQARTRHILKKNLREKGKRRLSKILVQYQTGKKVIIKIDSSVQKGMPHRRYHGKVGTISDKRGRSYIVNVTQGNAIKEIVVRPEHLESYAGD
jgi:large subunit ribosomal protein L21e